ncbi:MAG: DUF932 domain-containing protein [Tissierellales bacterium]|nr:DUF932 domain-containing protein [Tissierellales bacterium]
MKNKTFATSEQYLRTVPYPEDTTSYKRVLHGNLIDLTRQGIRQAGFTIEKESYTMAADGKIANGKYTIANIRDNEMQIQIAWQNSYNKQVTLKWAIGIHVFICGNGCVSGDMGSFKRKHTGDIQQLTPQWISDYISTAGDVFSEMQTIREEMKLIPVDIVVASEILGKLFFMEEVLHSTQMNIIKGELKKATHDYGAPGSLWELYNFVTFSLRTIHPSEWMDSHEKVHSYFTKILGWHSQISIDIVEEKVEESPYKQLDWTEEIKNY